jgi:hypothetical protein
MPWTVELFSKQQTKNDGVSGGEQVMHDGKDQRLVWSK